MNRSVAKALNLSYLYYPNEGELRFEDGVTYKIEEAVLLCKRKASNESQRAVHLVKKAFDGELITGATMYEPHRKVLQAAPVAALPEVVQRARKSKFACREPDPVQMRLEL